MSARDELLAVLDVPSEILADYILALHAHELAEKIRATDNGDYYASGPTQNAADLIDPEAP